MIEWMIDELDRAAGRTIQIPASCEPRRLASAAGVGALVGLSGFAGGPIVGVPSVALSASGAATLGLIYCAFDLQESKQ
ncbi:hypothetical protein [Luteibacter aegosomatissinici]|uniref:hypothetical protein n=1 Tax=Luteibacter aegosomatissinici TaxID=2911539 RepID=UPI001FFA864D|nr:hypothetical protein [Luteibacter aegosomatissinici]UPG93463.1 hypothetical protein L2Y97_16665 [Luteibacter aegosomatissinici]